MPTGEDNPLFDPVGSVMVLGAFAAVAAVVVRFRRSRGLERQQFKWLLFPVTMIVGTIVVDVVIGPVRGMFGIVVDVVNTVGLVGLPVAITLAIMRFRLYEIDRIISRTVTYTGVTAVLAAVYAAVAVLPATVLGASDPAGSGVSQLLVAAATLAAGVFVPVRRRVQAVVDRRFNRARYDARRVVERFGAGLRDDVDLVRLAGDLRGVVASTVEPAHVSLWLRGDGAVR